MSCNTTVYLSVIILNSCRYSRAQSEIVWGPKPSKISKQNHWLFYLVWGIDRIPSTILGIISSQVSSFMNPVGVITIVNPTAAPYFVRQALFYPYLLSFSSIKKDVEPVEPPMVGGNIIYSIEYIFGHWKFWCLQCPKLGQNIIFPNFFVSDSDQSVITGFSRSFFFDIYEIVMNYSSF